MRERISYYSDGLKLSGILNTPENAQGKRFPGVLLVPGFMSTADAFFPGFADELNKGGFVSLTMDFRGFGESEGVRGEVIPYLQIYDASNAISYVRPPRPRGAADSGSRPTRKGGCLNGPGW